MRLVNRVAPEYASTRVITWDDDTCNRKCHALRVHVPHNWVLRIWVIVIIVQVWGKYMIIGYLDP